MTYASSLPVSPTKDLPCRLGDLFASADAATDLEEKIHSTICRRVMEPADQRDCLVSPYYATADDCVLKCDAAAKSSDSDLYSGTGRWIQREKVIDG